MSTVTFTFPDITQNYGTQFVPGLENYLTSLAFMLDSTYVTSYTNTPTGAKRLRSGEFEMYNGSTWAKYNLSYLDNTAPVTYGSVSIAGSTNGYGGIQFSASAKKWTIMVRDSDGLTGVRNVTDALWLWYFDATGALGGGASVPYSIITGAPDLSIYAPKNNAALTGTPTAPTAAVDTNTGQLATTAFYSNQRGTATPLMDGTGSAGTSKRFASQDHRHPSDTAKADLSGADFSGPVTVNGFEVGTKRVPFQTSAGSTYTFVVGDVGKSKPLTAGNFQIPTGVFAAGDVFFAFNNSASSRSLVPLSGVTLRLSGTTSTGTRTLGPFALCMIYCIPGTNTFLCSGAGVS